MDYFNPAAFQPKNTWTPGSAQGALLYGQDRGNYNQLIDMFKSSQGVDLAKKQAEFQDYNLSAPVREARRLGDIGLAQKDQFTALPRAQADLNTILLRNQETKATMESGIASKIAENLKGKSDSEIGVVLNDLKRAQMFNAMARQMPGGAEGGQQLPVGITSLMDPSKGMDKMILQSPNPRAILEELAQTTPEYIREAMKADKTAAGQLAVAREQSASHKYVADVNDRSRKDVAKARAEAAAQAQGLEKSISQLIDKIAKGDKSPETAATLKYKQQLYLFAKQAELSARLGYGSNVAGGLGQAAIPQAPNPAGLSSQLGPVQPKQFTSEEEARQAIRTGLLKKGDKVVINGRSYTIGEQ